MSNDVSARAASWYYAEQFGFSKAPPRTDAEVLRNMALALITAANGDGNLSDEERAWILGYFATKGYPASIIEEMASLSGEEITALPELMQLGILKASGRILVYDAIRASSVDGYNEGERAAVRKAAALLGIDEASVAAIEKLVADEHALKLARIKVLMPTGHPNLDARYR